MSSATMAPPPVSKHTELFRTISQLLKEQPKLAAIVVSHVADKHEIYSLPAFHASQEITAELKLETYTEIVRGLAKAIRGEPHGLRGSAASGQAANPVAADTPPPPAPEAIAEREHPADEPAQPPAPKVEKPVESEDQRHAKGLTTDRSYVLPAAKPAAPAPAAPDDPITAQLRAIIKQILGPVDVSPEAIRKLVDEHIEAFLEKAKAAADERDAERAGDMRKELATACEKLAEHFKGSVEEAGKAVRAALMEFIKAELAKLPAGGARELRINIRGVTNKVEGITHRQFRQLATWVAADVPVWLWGAAGGGKTTLGEQIAQALGVPFTCVSIDETITVGKLVGFKNLANGDYVEGFLYRAYKDGGVVLLDEIDTNAATMAALNAMLANDHYTFGNGERVKRHENFRVLAGANTKGTGAVAGYTARVRLDAATLDRFAVIELKYDWDMIEAINGVAVQKHEMEWAPNEPASAAGIAAWTRWVRAVSEKFGTSVLISPRAALLGARALSAGIPVGEVAEALVFKLMDRDTRSRVTAAHPLPAIATLPAQQAA